MENHSPPIILDCSVPAKSTNRPIPSVLLGLWSLETLAGHSPGSSIVVQTRKLLRPRIIHLFARPCANRGIIPIRYLSATPALRSASRGESGEAPVPKTLLKPDIRRRYTWRLRMRPAFIHVDKYPDDLHIVGIIPHRLEKIRE